MKRKVKLVVDEERVELMMGLMSTIYFVVNEILGIWIATELQNYVLLSIFTYVWVLLITECFVKKYVFEKIVKILLKKTSISNLVFFILACITFALSWKYFIAFIFCIPQAILYGEYCKFKNQK